MELELVKRCVTQIASLAAKVRFNRNFNLKKNSLTQINILKFKTTFLDNWLKFVCR